MLFDTPSAVDALEDLLDHERRMILAGKLADVALNAHKKELLLTRLAVTDGSETLDRVRRKAQRNQALLEAAARGLKAARDRLEALVAVPPQTRTYGADGKARDLAGPAAKRGINHRA